MNRIARLISSICTLCLAFVALAFGIFAATTTTYNLNSTVSFIADGVYLYVAGEVWQGADKQTLAQVATPESYSYESTNYATEQNSFEPDGTASFTELETWEIGEIAFDTTNAVIEVRVEFTNYSEFDIVLDIDNSTPALDNVKMEEEENKTSKLSYKETATYTLRLTLTDFSQEVDLDIDVHVTAEKEKDIDKDVSNETFTYRDITTEEYEFFTTIFEQMDLDTDLIKPDEKYLFLSDELLKESLEIDTLTIPSEIDGVPVKNLAPFFLLDFSNPENMAAIKKVIIEEGIKGIDGAFAMTSVQQAVIPGSVTSSFMSFAACQNLTEVTVEEGVTELGGGMFAGCTNLTTLNLPDSLVALTAEGDSEESCLRDLENLTVTLYNGGRYLATKTNPYAILLQQSRQDEETTVIHPDTKIIGERSLANAKGVFVVPDNVVTIERKAFFDGKSITGLVIPKSTTRIDHNIIGGCSFLEQIIVDEENPVYDSRNNCNSIIETATNKLVAGTTAYDIYPEVEIISKECFYACYETGETLVIPQSVRIIEDNAFAAIDAKNVVLPSNLQTIGKQAFYLSNISGEVVIPKSVTLIEEQAFACRFISSITVEQGNTVYDSRDNCNAIIETKTNTLIKACKNTVIPSSVTKIGSMAFSLIEFEKAEGEEVHIIIPENITEFGVKVFASMEGCDSITFPSNLTTIGRDSLYALCSKCIILATTPPTLIGEQNVHSSTKIYVPKGSLQTYLNDSSWSAFADYIYELEE